MVLIDEKSRRNMIFKTIRKKDLIKVETTALNSYIYQHVIEL